MKRRTGGTTDHGEWDVTPLEIEFEDGDEQDGTAAPEPAVPGADDSPRARTDAARRRRTWQLSAAAAVVAVLAGAAALATRGGGTGSAPPSRVYVDNSAAVHITYLNSHLVSAAERRLEVELRVTPIQSQPVKITGITVSEGGVSVAPVGTSDTLDIPATGQNLLLLWTVRDCGRVPMDESMAYVEVITLSPGGLVMDRFTILGDRYAADISRLLHTVCGTPLAPGATPGPATPHATGPLGTVS